MPSILRCLLPGAVRRCGIISFAAYRDRVLLACMLSVLASIALLSGCSKGSSVQMQAGTITVLDVNGKTIEARVLAVGSTLTLGMTAQSDSLHAGIDWSVVCGGNSVTGSIKNGACGTLSPAHTSTEGKTTFTAPSTIPIDAIVTITATMTGNPSQAATLKFTILSSPITVGLLTTPPLTQATNSTLPLRAQVLNDTTNSGLVWTAACGSTACGSFSSSTALQTVYTAPSAVPAGNTVSITATSVADSSKRVSFPLTIVPPSTANPISVRVAPASLAVQTSGAARTAKFIAIVANDSASSGVDWSVSCGSASCGSITGHTASGVAATYLGPTTVPSGNVVTVTAKSTSDPTASATGQATIVTSAPIVVSFSPTPSTTMLTGTTTTLTARTTSDTGNLGVNWTVSCSSSSGACGSFNLNPAHTASNGQIVYQAPQTVPSDGVVTITAATPSSAASVPAVAVINLTAQSPAVTLTQAPPATMTALTQAPVSATVANDKDPGGVSWSVECGNTTPGSCGWIAPVKTASGGTAIYTAPPATVAGTSVTIKATSVALPSAIASSSAVAIHPDPTLSVSFVPALPSFVSTDATVSLKASVANDPTDAGVDWEVCASGCGFFTVKPALPEVPATETTPYVPPVAAVTATTVTGWPNGLPIPYTAPSFVPSSGSVAVAAYAHADRSRAMSGTIAVSSLPRRPALNGIVQAGSQAVRGASVSLLAAGATGYASAATPVATAVTDKNGIYSIAEGYSCGSDEQMYLLASGGSVGGASANPNLAFLAVLGPCSGLSSSSAVVNEVTTVAAAFALAPFSANHALTGNSSSLYLGSSASNLTGLSNAFATVSNLVDLSTGKARYVIPSGNAEVPYALLNTAASALNACAITSGGVQGDGSPCGDLFTATDVLPQHTLYNSIAPSNTLQAAFNLAQHPVVNYGYTLDSDHILYPLASSSATYLPLLPSAPANWSVSLHYTRGGGLSSSSSVGSLAIDATGNLWITDAKAGSVIEWTGTGAALSPATGFPAGGSQIAIDPLGKIWISGAGTLSELTSLGTPMLGSPFVGVANGGNDMAIDPQGHIWIANGAGVAEYDNLGVLRSPSAGYVNDGVTDIGAIGFDISNNVWVGNGSHTNFAQLTNPGGQLVVQSQDSRQGSILSQLVPDGAGNMWGVSGQADMVCQVPKYGGLGSILIVDNTCYPDDGNANSSVVGLNYFNVRGLAFDGDGFLWVASQGGGSSPVIAPSVLPIKPSLFAGGGTPNYLSAPSLAAGTLRVAVDGSGNLWVLLADNTVTEYVGVAVPTMNPLSLALKNKKVGARP